MHLCKRLFLKPRFHLECPVKLCQSLSYLDRLSYGDRPHLGEASRRRVERASRAGRLGGYLAPWTVAWMCLLSF